MFSSSANRLAWLLRPARLGSRVRYVPLVAVAFIGLELGVAALQPHQLDAAAPLTQEVSGRALFPGAIVGDVRYGVTFSGITDGTFPGWWTATVNYTPSSADGGMINRLVGGRWQFTRIENGLYKGTLFGDVTGGTIERDPTGIWANVSIDFDVTGGTGAYAGATGTGQLLNGTADHTPFPPTLDGEIVFHLDQ